MERFYLETLGESIVSDFELNRPTPPAAPPVVPPAPPPPPVPPPPPAPLRKPVLGPAPIRSAAARSTLPAASRQVSESSVSADRVPRTTVNRDVVLPLPQPGTWGISWRHFLPVGAGTVRAAVEEKRRQVPSWLISFVAHLALMIMLALVPLARLSKGPLTLIFGTSAPAGVAEFELAGPGEITSIEAEMTSLEPQPVEPTKILESLQLAEVNPVNLNKTLSPVEALTSLPTGIKDGLVGRSGALKGALLSKFGGNAETENAVEMGLKWLSKNQMSDGSWSLTGPYRDGGANENRTAATAMAVNAFLGAGYTPKEGPYADNVRLGLAYLLKRQDKDGFFAGREPSRQQMYAQAIATITFCEAAGMTGNADYRIAGQKAIQFAEWSQSKLKGWRYDPRIDADLSVTGWYLMAFVTAKMTGFAVDEEIFQSVSTFLDSVQHEDGSRFAYKEYDPPSLSMTAEGLLCRIYLGMGRTDPALMRAIRDDLLPNAPRADEPMSSVYYWYYATQVLHHYGGRAWIEWNDAMKSVLPALQEKGGAEAGSWDPQKDQFGPSGGRLYTTCLNIYCLEVYYRHLAMYSLD
jgi:hypothetical protein